MQDFKNKLTSKLREFSSIYRIGHFLLKNYFKRTILVIILSFLSSFSEVIGVLTIVPIFLLIAGEQAPEDGLANTVYNFFSELGLADNLLLVLTFFVLALTTKSILKLANSVLIGNTFALIARNFRLKLTKVIVNAEWNYFVTQRAGTLANAISSEPEKAARSFSYFTKFINAAIQISFYLIVSFAASILVSLSTLIYALILFFTIIFIHNIYVSSMQNLAQGIKTMTGKLTEYLLLLKPIKAMHNSFVITNMLDKEAESINVNAKKEQLLGAAVTSLQEPLIAIFICLFLYASVYIFAFSVTEIILLSFIFYRLVSYLAVLQGGYLNIVRLDVFMKSLSNTIENAENNKEEWEGKRTLKFKSNIIFKNVTFKYTKRKIVENLSIKLNSKKIVTFCGPSGCGKTTVIDLIIGLYKPNSGEILIDNIPLNEINIKNWRRQIGYVPQETILLNNTILENITLGTKYKKKELDFVMKAAEIDKFINRLPKKINSIIGERGIMLSGGQRQRISIARALIKRPKIMILDEATANLDPKTERKICKILKKISKKTMIIAISHQKELTSIADEVFTFSSNGRVIKK